MNCQHCKKVFEKVKLHERYCVLNPDKKDWNKNGKRKKRSDVGRGENQYTKAARLGLKVSLTDETKKKISNSLKGKTLSEDHRKTISKTMKVAHAEGRAWNIGKSRWNNQPSWPEKFTIQVIENEFSDKQYVREFSVGIYSIDFAWPHKKLAIEIDGEQHERFKEYRERDQRKDLLLQSEGWKILRIKWKDLFADSKTFINKMKNFIDT